MRRQRNGRKFKKIAMAAAPLLGALWAMPGFGQTLTWDASGSTPLTPVDGSGNWNTSVDANWSDGASNLTWVNGNIAAIGNGGVAGTITINDVSGTVSAGGINFNPVGSGSYAIAASGANTLTLTGGGLINVASGVTGSISAPIAGNVGLTMSGASGTLNLTGNNTFTGVAQINTGTVIVGAGGNLGSSSNLVSLGTPNTGTSTNDPVGNLILNNGGNTNVNSFKSSTNNAAVNTITIGSGATLNVTSSSPLSGLNSTVNGAFIVGSSNLSAAIATNLTISGAGSLSVSGGSNNSSFLVGIGNTNSSANAMTPNLNMSGLANFSFVTGTGAIPAGGGNEFAVGHGAGAQATASLAVNNTIVAGTITVGDHSNTPGLTGAGANAPASASTLNFGSGANTLQANNFIIGNVRSQSNVGWASGVNTGTLLLTGAAGGASTANITVGVLASGTPPSTASKLTLDDHNVTVQAGTVIVGNMAGGTGGTSATKGGSISFNTGVFNISDLTLALGTSGTSTGNIAGTFTVGSSANSTGVLNVSNSFKIGAATGGAAPAKGTFNVKGGTANINSNIIDVSTVGTSSTTVALTGGTLNMNGFAIGPKVAAGNTGAVGTRNITTITFPSLGNVATLQSLGGTGINDAGLTMSGTGVLVLEGNSTYSGATTITSGILQVGQNSDTVSPSSALPAAVTDNATLAYGSSQPLTVNSMITGTGGVSQTGSGITTVTSTNSYGGPTSFVAGTLSVGAIPNGGVNSPLGSSSSAASNLVLTGGALQYTGGGASTDRLFSVTPTGGKIDASGSGALAFTNVGANVSADAPPRATTDSITTPKVTLANVNDLVVGMTVTGANIPGGTTIIAINPTANSITLSNTPTAAGADTLSFGIADRVLTLTGSGTGSIAGSLANSAGGAKLGLTKSGAGKWTLSGANSYGGNTTISGGSLQFNGAAAWAPALTGPGTTDIKGSAAIFDYNDGSPDPAATIKTILTNAFATGFTTPTDQIHSSTATASIGLGWHDDTSAKQVTVLRTLYGDANLDLSVDTVDFNLLAASFSQTGAVWNQGDFNYDGSVDTVDFNLLAANFAQTVSGASAASGGNLGALVPEPASGALLLLSSVLPALRRRRARFSKAEIKQ